jgi:prepilin-type N-terminal cleavage/methylation domain-containing protein
MNGIVLKYRVFTLVELLMVILVIGVLMGIGLPAFNRMMTGQGVNGGARQVGGMIKMTRAYAVGNSKYAAVIFPTNDSIFTGVDIPLKYYFTSYRPCEVTYDGSTCKFVRWIPATKWNFVPTGTVIDFYDDTSGDHITVKNGKAVEEVDFSDIEGVASGANDVDVPATAAIVFKPSGNSNFSSSEIKIKVQEGQYSGSTVILKNVNTTPGDTDEREEAFNNIGIEVNPYTGRISYNNE